MLVEAHNSVGKVESYHKPLRRAFDILRAEITELTSDLILQMAVKAVNDTAGPNGLVPTLLLFGAYPRMGAQHAPSLSITKRAQAIEQATEEVQRIQAETKVQAALARRNGPNTHSILDLPL